MFTSNELSTITQLDPNVATVGDPALILIVTGTNFSPGSVVRWNGNPRHTLFASRTRLIAVILAADLAEAAAAKVDVLTPFERPIEDTTVIQVIMGTNFTSSSVVNWKGRPRPTIYVSEKQLIATIPSEDIVAAAKEETVVFTPSVNSLNFDILSHTLPIPGIERPVITRLEPSHRPAGSSGFDLIVNGKNFAENSKVLWNGVGNDAIRVTFFKSNFKLVAKIPASDLTEPGFIPVRVMTPLQICDMPSSANTRSNIMQFDSPLTDIATSNIAIFTSSTMDIVSAATMSVGAIANESIALGVRRQAGDILAFIPADAAPGQTEPYLPAGPMQNGRTSIAMQNSTPGQIGSVSNSPLFSVGLAELKFLVPMESQIHTGEVQVTDTTELETPGVRQLGTFIGVADIATVAPGLFSVDGTGHGLADGRAVRKLQGGGEATNAIATKNDAGAVVANPIVMAGTTQVFLLLNGTGIRHHSGMANVCALIDGRKATVSEAGPLNSSIGLDRVKLEVPAGISTGIPRLVNVELKVDNQPANVVQISVQ